MDRAAYCWDDDRKKIAEDLGAKLSLDPSRVAQALRTTRFGAEWMLVRWEGLRATAAGQGAWDEDERSLAFDLLGTPRVLRKGTHWVPAGTDGAALAQLAEREIDKLRAGIDGYLQEFEDAARSMAMGTMPQTEDLITIRIRRYECRLRRDLTRAREELLRVRAGESAETSKSQARGVLPDSARPITDKSFGFHSRRQDAPFAVPSQLDAVNDADELSTRVEAQPDMAEQSEGVAVETEAPAVVAEESPAVEEEPRASAVDPGVRTENRKQRRARLRRLRQALAANKKKR
jgi:hypothetical protein